VYVCAAATSPTYLDYPPEILGGLLISPGLETRLWGGTKFWPQGYPPIVTPCEIPQSGKNWAEASKQKLLLGVNLYGKILF
jgi:hypothetical protein